MNFDGLKNDVLRLLAGCKVGVKTITFGNDLSAIRSKDDALTALIHLGYLGYDAERSQAYLPNYEVATAYEAALETGNWQEVARSNIKGDDSMQTIALIAHDKKKDEMLEFVGHHKDLLKNFHLVATRTTGTLINEKYELDVETMMSGPLGGDQQIGAMIAVEKVDFVIFLRDPLTSQPHEPDINALLRLCDVHNIPLATNRKSGHIMLEYVAKKMNS